MPEELTLQSEHWDTMLTDVRRRAPEEACGLVAGREGLTCRVFPVSNELRSRTRFRMDPAELLKVLLEIEEAGCELLAIYHSHPAGPERPSATDIAEAAYPGVIHLIWHFQAGAWECLGFLIEEQQVTPVSLRVTFEPAEC